jgi:hypothetical protein
MPPLHYFLSLTSFWVAALFAFSVVTGVFGINAMTRKLAVLLLAIGAVLTFGAVWQAALQSYDQDEKYNTLYQSISGGDSYPEVIPEGHDTIAYAILNVGHTILPSVSITPVHIGNPPNGEIQTNINVGTLAPSTSPNFMFVHLPIGPILDEKFSMMTGGEKVDTYMLYMNAPNGTTIELIQFKKGKCAPLATRYKISPPPQLNIPSKGFTEWEDLKC